MEDIPNKALCTNDEAFEKREQCLNELCSCIQMINIDLNQVSKKFIDQWTYCTPN